MNQIDLSKLPAPEIVVQKAIDEILQERLAALQAEGIDIDNFTASDPVYRNLLASSYREFLIRADANEQTLGNMLAFATGSQLDNIAANPLYNIERLEGESDEAFKRRIQLTPEGFSVAGPEGKYIFEALSASPEVKDASFESPAPMHGDVTILSNLGNGLPEQELIDTVAEHLLSDEVRPQTDLITVKAATILPYSISAQLTLAEGPDVEQVVSQATANLQAYVDTQHRLGGQVVIAGVYGALMVEGMIDITLNNFTEIKASKSEAPYCTELVIS